MSKESSKNFSARPVLRVNLKAIGENYKKIQGLVGKTTKVAASVKANAYGLGVERVSRSLYGAGCRTFFVATAGEGKILREAIGDNATIYVLNGPGPRDMSLFFGSRLKPVLNSLEQIRIWQVATKGVKHVPFSALHIDTGINRLGFSLSEFEQIARNPKLIEALGVDHVMSHLACAPDASNAYNAEQLSTFKKLASKLPMLPMSMANTAGIYLGKPYHFQMVRPGIGLYGGVATNNPAQEVSTPVVSLMAPVLQVRDLRHGDRIGYNSTYQAERDIKVAIIGAGYADGIPVAFSSEKQKPQGYATLQSRRIPIIGRVSMDLTALDVSSLRIPPAIGDWAEFLGENLEQDASAAATINYEMLTRLGSRARREYR